MIEKPTSSEEVFVINEDLNAHYSTFKDGFSFFRRGDSWPNWEKLPYRDPSENPWLIEAVADGVKFERCEHLSVVLKGHAVHTLQTPTGPKDYVWNVGDHTLDQGIGYLPSEYNTRVFSDGFTTCCIVQPFAGRDTPARYSFEVLTGPKTLDRDALAVHYCATKQTVTGTAAGVHLAIAVGEIAIVVYQES
jgi:hypothetical protein